jgi:Zn-dependent protease
MALFWAFVAHLAVGPLASDGMYRMSQIGIAINLMLMVLNLLPVPPLDGGRIAVGLLPGSLAFPLARLEPYGMWIVIGLLLILPLVTQQLGSEINPFMTLIYPIVNAIIGAIATVVGLGAPT